MLERKPYRYLKTIYRMKAYQANIEQSTYTETPSPGHYQNACPEAEQISSKHESIHINYQKQSTLESF